MRWLALAMVSVGCIGTPPNDDGQFGEEGAHCEVVARTPLGLDEVSPLGFTAQAVLDFAAGTHAATLAWEDGSRTPLSLVIEPVGDIEYLEQAVVDDGNGSGEEPALAPLCPNVLSIGVDIGLSTEDGALAEQWLGTLEADTVELARFGRDLDDVAGTFDAWDHAPEGVAFDEVHAWLDTTISAAGPEGLISGQGSGTDGDPNDPNGTSWAQSFEIGIF